MARANAGDLGEQVYRAFSGGLSSGTEPHTFSDALRFFVNLAGGNISGAARAAGVPRRTFRDWLAGSGLGPRSAERRAQVAAAAKRQVRGQRAGRRVARVRGREPHGIVVKGKYNYTGEYREAEVGVYMEPDSLDQLADAYLDGASPEGLRGLFASLITGDNGFYGRTMALEQSDAHGWTVDKVVLT